MTTPIIIPTPMPIVTPSFTKESDVNENMLNRQDDPVVLTGKDIGSLKGIKPGELVAWRYNGKWEQIPVQVDEKDYVDLMDVYDTNQYIRDLYELAGRKPVKILTYTDSDTFTGADSDASIDENDEIVFMAKDAGKKVDTNLGPRGVLYNSCVEIEICDPADKSKTAYVYLFKQDGMLDQSAGRRYVDYNFKLLSGDYKNTYKTGGGPNFEDSTVITNSYAHHFSDRWINDGLYIFRGSTNGVNILDRHKNLFAPGNPVRSEDTFSFGAAEGFPGEGCFVVNKSGPVRAIRSYMGANSGFYTQRQHIFYESRQDITTYLRVHSINGVMDFFDYTPEADGMKYYNNLNTEGVTIDGVQDDVVPGMIEWEMVSGKQGSLLISYGINTDIPDFTYSSYYLDAKEPDVKQCTGDAYAYGSSGIWIKQPIPNTDPSDKDCKRLEIERRIYYKEPGLSVDDAQRLNSNANIPVSFTVNNISFNPTPTPDTLKDEKIVISGYVKPDFASVNDSLKTGFRVTVVGTGFDAITDSQGFFKIEALPTISGSYSLEISKPGYLLRTVSGISGNTDTQIGSLAEAIDMWAGDMPVNEKADNVVNMADIIQVAKGFNTSKGEAKYNDIYDINMDCVINMADLIIVAKHFNQSSSDYPDALK